MLRLELKKADSGQPGYGKLVVHGWTGNPEGVELTVTRNQDGRYLEASGGWSTNPTWHALDTLQQEVDALTVEVGPWLIDPLVLDPQMAYQVVLRVGEHQGKSVLRVDGSILSSQAAGSSIREDQRVKPAAPAPVVETAAEDIIPEPEPEPVIEPEPIEPEPEVVVPPAPVEKKRSKLPLILLLLLVLLLLGALLWWFLLRTPAEESPAAVAAGEAAACSSDALKQTRDDLVFIQQCLKSNPGSAQVLEVIATAKQAKRCGVMQRLYAHKAQAGDAAIAFAYAQEYDPDTFSKGGCIASADKETAAYWYEIAVNNDPKNEKASQRLEALRK